MTTLSAIRLPREMFYDGGALMVTMTLLEEQDRRLADKVDIANTRKRRLDALRAVRNFAFGAADTGRVPKHTLAEYCVSALLRDDTMPSFVYPGHIMKHFSADGAVACPCRAESDVCAFRSFLTEAQEAEDAIVFCVERPWDVI